MIGRLIIIWLLGFGCSAYAAGAIPIVAAENFYGEVATELGGNYVQVTSILSNPQQDPHLFTSTPATAKAIADARFVVYNGLGYDIWMQNLISATGDGVKNKHIIIMGNLTNKTMGDNPHIWYDPNTMLVYANYLTAQLSQTDAAHQEFYHQQLDTFKTQYAALLEKIQRLQSQYRGTPVIATEPVFNYMADALGLVMNGQNFQTSVMNGTEPSASATREFEDKLNRHQVKLLIYNNQVMNPTTERMQKLAQKNGIPSVGVSETEPAGQTYFSWMNNQLDALNTALKK